MTVKKALLLVLVAFLLVVTPVLAMASLNHDLSWHLFSGGGGLMGSSNHSLQGSLGQPLVDWMGSSTHDLCSGFWCSGEAVYQVYLPMTVK